MDIVEQVRQWFPDTDSYVGGAYDKYSQIESQQIESYEEQLRRLMTLNRCIGKKEMYDDEYGVETIKASDDIKGVALLACRADDERLNISTRQHNYNNAKDLLYRNLKNDPNMIARFEPLLQKAGNEINSQMTTLTVKHEKGFNIKSI